MSKFKEFLDWFARADAGAREDVAKDLRVGSAVAFILAIIACPFLPFGSAVAALTLLGAGDVLKLSSVAFGSSPTGFVLTLIFAIALRVAAFLVRYKK